MPGIDCVDADADRWPIVGVPPIARVEPITTARALRGPFDYLRPEGVGVGSMLVVPFGHRDVLGVVVGIAEESEVADERLVEPARGARRGAPGRSRRARGLDRGRVLLHAGARALARLPAPGREGAHGVVGGGDRPDPTAHGAPARAARLGRDAAGRRRGPPRAAAPGAPRARAARAPRRAPRTRARGRRRAAGAAGRLPPTRRPRSPRSRRRSRRAIRRGCCCTASPARARPRSTCRPPRRRSPRGAARSCSCPRSR